MIELARLFLRLGVTAFGGPAAHIAMLHDEVVERRGWLDDQHFLDLVGATNLIPGPNSTEMIMHVGYERRRLPGLVVSGVSFILPAAAIVLLLAYLYVRFGSTPGGEALLWGIKPVVVVIILRALVKLGRAAVSSRLYAALALLLTAAYLLGIPEIPLLVVGGLVALLADRVWRPEAGLAFLPITLIPTLASLQGAPEITLARLFRFFLRVGSILYGSGYVLVAFLRGDLVERWGWLTDAQLLDAIAIGQLTPGPVLTTATFVGYVLAGLPGAVVATLGIFLPSFLFVAILNPLVPRLRERRWSAVLLDGINVAAVALMAGVTLQLGVAAIAGIPALVVAAVAAILLFRYRVGTSRLVVGGGFAGLIWGALQGGVA